MLQIKLEEITATTPESIKVCQLLRTGNFKYGGYGAFEITTDHLRKIKANYDSKVRGVKLAVDYFHEAFEEAAGWIEQIELRNGDNELWITVDWTPKAVEKIMAKEVRYLSADIDFNYIDIESGQEYGCTLLGAGLTNRPYIKNMKAILSELSDSDKKELKQILLNDKKEEKNMVKFEEMLAAVSSLTDDEKAQLAEKLGAKVKASEEALQLAEKVKADAEAKLSEKDLQLKKLSEDVTALKTEVETEKKKAKFDAMFSEGKVVEAQRKAFMEGDMETFVANAVKLNLSEQGTGADDTAEADTAIIKLNEKAEEIVKSRNVTFSEAFKIARKENPKLAEAAD